MAVLSIEKGKQKGLRYEVPDAALPTVLGRDASADAVIDDERASRHHARILRKLGGWVIEDMGSRNGILFQGGMVRRAELKDGDLFQIGSTVLQLRQGERIDPFSGMEVQGSRLLRLLSDEAGVLTYRAHQLAMDRPVRIDILHPRWPLVGPPSADGKGGSRHLIAPLEQAARAAAEIQHPRVNPLIRAELPEEGGGGYAMLRWHEAPSLADLLPEFFKLPTALRIRCFRLLAEAVLARSAEPLCYPIGLRHILLDPEEGPQIQALELPALLGLLKGQLAHLPAFPDYLAPEQAGEEARPSRPALIYNLGAIGYRLVTKIPAMGEGSVAEILERHRSLPPAPADLACPEVPGTLGSLLSKMLEKDPSLRPHSAEEILEAITARPEAIDTAPPPARPAPPDRQGPARTTPRWPVPPPAVSGSGGSAPASAAPDPRPDGTIAPRPLPAIDIPARRRMPVLLHLIFWPALWCGLVFGGRQLMKEILDQLGR